MKQVGHPEYGLKDVELIRQILCFRPLPQTGASSFWKLELTSHKGSNQKEFTTRSLRLSGCQVD